MSASGGKAGHANCSAECPLSPKANILNYLEVATAPSWMSIPSLSRQTHSSASFPSRMRNIVSDDQVTTLPSATA